MNTPVPESGAGYPLPDLDFATRDLVYKRFAAAFAADTVVPDALVWESTETVDNRPASWRDLRRALRRLPLKATLQLLGTIAVEIERGRHPVDAALQLRVARRFGGATRRGRGLMRRLFESPKSVLVAEEQVAVLAAYAIVNCEADLWPADGDELFLEALLAYHSLKGGELHDNRDAHASLRRTEMRSTATDPESVPDVLARWRNFTRWSELPEAESSRNFLRLGEIFERHLGMGQIAWAAATWALVAYFAQIAVTPAGHRRYDAFLDVDAYLASLTDRTQISRWLDQVSVDLSDVRQAFQGLRTTSLAELELLMDRPLVRTPWGLCCPVHRFLPNVGGNGLLFRLGDHLERATPGASARLRGFFGDYLETHVEQLFRAAARKRVVQIFRERRYGRPEMKSSDLVIVDGKRAVFIDVTATRFHQRESVVSLVDTTIERDLRRFVTDKLTQEIARCARDFRSGLLMYEGVDPDSIDDIYGLVVSPQGLPRLVGLTQMIETLVPVVPTGLSEWDYFDLNEVEALPSVFDGALDLSQLIVDKRSDYFGRPRSLMNYMYFRRRSLITGSRSREDILRDPWMVDVMAQVRAWGLRADSAPLPEP